MVILRNRCGDLLLKIYFSDLGGCKPQFLNMWMKQNVIVLDCVDTLQHDINRLVYWTGAIN